jgi:EAL domain-containing protein (putative c-di-GMP-specific phosphodiesterase class I)/GGDEF domain-containing protein
MADSPLLPALAAALGAAGLAWQAARQFDQAPAAGPWTARAARQGAGLLLLALAVAWPLRLTTPLAVGAADALAAAAVAALAWVAAQTWSRGRALPAAAAAVLAAPGAWWSMHPHAGRALDAPDPVVTMLAPAVAPLLAAALQPPSATRRRARAVGVALFATLGAAAAARAPDATVPGGLWLLLLALVGVVALQEATASVPRPPAPATERAEPAAARPPLTRGEIERALEQALLAGQGFAVLRIELEDLDGMGQMLGPPLVLRVLDKVTRRLQHLLRGDDCLARLGDGHYLLLTHGVAEQVAVERLAQRVIAAVGRPILAGERELRPACTVGSVTGPGRLDVQRLIGATEQAVRQARRAGQRHRPFAADDADDGDTDRELLQALREAIAGDALSLQFQPKIDARDGKVTAVEALLRWEHPQRGRISPGVFVPLAERHGLMVPLGDWVMHAAARELRRWCDHGLRLRVAINVSAQQMQQPDLARRLQRALRRHRAPASLMTCEITETAAMQDTGTAQQIFRELGAMGVNVSIDDFGTGYSSLAYLRKLPARELKIDRAFVSDLGHSDDARAVVDAVVRLAHALGLKVVAEGVETVQQQRLLVELGCDELQGYLLARPMDGDGLLMWALNDRAHRQAFAGDVFTGSDGAPPAGAVTAP